jgi:protein-disulfide isomerase
MNEVWSPAALAASCQENWMIVAQAFSFRWVLPLVCLALLIVTGRSAEAAEFSTAQKSEIEKIVREYLVNNPELLRDAQAELERRQKDEENQARKKIVTEQAGTLYSSNYQATVGNPNGKVTIVEFFDYNCGYCKRALEDMTRLMKSEPDLKIVLKDFPVLGPGSIEAAKIASAVRNQFKGDRFWEYHLRLLGSHGPVGKAQALAVAKELGADMDRVAKESETADTRKGIEESMQLADALSLTGTPSFVVGSDIVVGAVGYDELKNKIGNIRKCGKADCS